MFHKMSIEVGRDRLTPDQKVLLRSLLTLVPTPPRRPGPPVYFTEPRAPIVFFETEGAVVRIPYTVGVTLLQDFVNHRLLRPKLPFRFTGELFEHQREVVTEALAQLRTKGTTTLGTYPGSGKTVMGAWLAANVWPQSTECELVLVIHPIRVLNSSWANTFKEFTDARVWVVGEEPVPRITLNVIVCLDQRVEKVPPELLRMVGFLVLDEAHKLCTPSKVHALLATQPKYIVAETATLERPDDGMHAMIYALVGTHSVNRISTKPFSVTKLLTGIVVPLTIGPRGVNFQALGKALAADERRNQLAVELVTANLAKGWKIIILTPLKDHVTLLHRALLQRGVKCDFMMGTKSSYEDSDVLLGTVSKIGTGFDEKMACPDFGGKRADLLIYMASTKKAGLMEQNVGRVFRAETPAVIHFVDDNPISKRHWSEAQKWYRSRGGSIVEVRVTPTQRVYDVSGALTGYA